MSQPGGQDVCLPKQGPRNPCQPTEVAQRVPFPEQSCGAMGCVLSQLLQGPLGAGGLVT